MAGSADGDSCYGSNKTHVTELSVGTLFKDDPSKLLELLEDNLEEVLEMHPELEEAKDKIAMFPCPVNRRDMNDFYGLLECEIFSNYINLFLNLPVFARRMTYRSDIKRFSLEPPIKRRRFRIDHGKVTAWVLVCRMPYFLKSDFYLEYRLSFELLNDLYFDGKSLHLYHELKTPVGVNRFRVFLHSRAMTKLISFWMDSERFHMLHEDKARKECFNAIEILYLKSGSRFELPEQLRKGIIDKIEKEQNSTLVEVFVHSVPLIERIKKKEIDKIKNFKTVGTLLKTAQLEVLGFLRNYWVPRYFTRNGLPYSDSSDMESNKVKSHLVWSTDHKVAPVEPMLVSGFGGQTPDDFETVGESVGAPQGGGPSDNSVWSMDFTSKMKNKKKEKKKFKKFTLFEQARTRSFAVNGSRTGSELTNDYMKQLSELRLSHHSGQRNSSHLTPVGVDFARGNSFCPQPQQSLHPGAEPPGLVIALEPPHETTVRTSSVSSSTEHRQAKVSLGTSLTAEPPENNLSAFSGPPDLPKLGVSTSNTQPLLVLPTLTKTNVAKQGSVRFSIDSQQSTTSVSTDTTEEETVWDPYLLLEKVNPTLMKKMNPEQMNTRKWILGALAANSLCGKPVQDHLKTFRSFDRRPSDLPGDQEASPKGFYSKDISTALNNLDCWERIERIRATSSTSYAGRRADEITNAGGWAGLDAPRLLPTYHHYLATLSGELLESHLEPFQETRYILRHYLSDKEVLGMDEEVRRVLREMLKSCKVDDSWYALLQEHNLSQLTGRILKFFAWDDERLLLNCAPSKEKCKHQLLTSSLSASSVQHDAFNEEVTRDLTNQYIFSPRSEKVWLSLFAIEVSSYRPAEVYFPPIPTTTKSVGCSCTEEGISKGSFESADRGRQARPKSVLMTESQANLAKLQDCRTSAQAAKKRKKRPMVSLIQRISSQQSNADMSSDSCSISSTSTTAARRKVHKRLYPSTFKQILAEPYYFNIFMKYLELNMADETEAPIINFWHQVEIMKSYKNAKARKDKAISIHKKYLYTPQHAPRRDYLNVDCSQLTEISEKKQITPSNMIVAQTYICKILEDRWWLTYKGYMEDETSANAILQSSIDVANANIDCGKDYRANIRYLWGIFTFDLINFQNGLRNQKVYSEFRDYLRKTASKLRLSKGRRVKDGSVFIVVNGLSVFADRLDNDLEFFVEISKWICLKCDMSGTRGKLAKSSETLLVSKAHAIVACYLKSAVPPRVRVNLSQAIINEIEKKLDDHKKFYRGLFYNAVLHMITMLLHFWKKFCFVHSAKDSDKDRSLIATVSGHAISPMSNSCLKELPYNEDKHMEKLGEIVKQRVDSREEGTVEPIKGLHRRVGQQDKTLGRRDATFPLQKSFAQGTHECLVYQFSLLTGMCNLKYESGLEVPHGCEVMITAQREEIEYLLTPLPRLKSTLTPLLLPTHLKANPSFRNPSLHRNSKMTAASRAVSRAFSKL